MLIAEDLLLLAVDDETGKTANVDNLSARLAGALLADLADANRILTQGGPEAGASKEERKEAADAKILITNNDPVGHVALDAALEAAQGEERRASKVVERIAEDAEDNLLAGLAERGILEKEETKLFRMLPQTRWPAADSSHEDALRSTLTKVLVEGAEPDERTATLVSLLHGTGLVGNVVGKENRKAAEERAEEIAGSEWGAANVAAQVAIAASAVAVVAAAGVAAALILAATKEDEESAEPAEATSQA
ncbi:hypothetical protein GCM10028784_22760 [Myceligenerans cantabricum]